MAMPAYVAAYAYTDVFEFAGRHKVACALGSIGSAATTGFRISA